MTIDDAETGSPIDAEAQRLAEAGDLAGAATLLIQTYGPGVIGWLKALTGTPEEADEVFAVWKENLTQAAACPNLVLKVGGMAMPWNGFGWEAREKPPSSDEFVAAYSRYYDHGIQSFGPDRCMFESNFPVDKLSLSYHVLWNAFKKLAAGYSEDEKAALFGGTARRVYSVTDA